MARLDKASEVTGLAVARVGVGVRCYEEWSGGYAGFGRRFGQC